MSIEAIDAPAGATITLQTTVVAQCPFGDGQDEYDLTVTIESAGKSVECGSFAAYLSEFSDREISQEALTAEVAEHIRHGLTDATVTVRTHGAHSGIETVVEA